jgi:enoyl-CoA hydratase/carnithine racemase
MIRTEVLGDVHVVTMDAGENRFNLAFATELVEAIERAAGDAGALVLTGVDRFFSNGLDLEWLSTAGPEGAAATMGRINAALAALLRFPGATVAAINGHAFGAGAILAAATDLRVMRSDRGYFCFPEVDLGLPMSEEFDAVLQDAFDRRTLRRALLRGTRYGGAAALEAGLVDQTAVADGVLEAAMALATGLAGKDGRTVAVLREPLVRRSLAVLPPA